MALTGQRRLHVTPSTIERAYTYRQCHVIQICCISVLMDGQNFEKDYFSKPSKYKTIKQYSANPE